jgi:hypothetical protein
MMNNAPLIEFDVRIVQAPLQGILRNMNEELDRRLRQAMSLRDKEAERTLSLLLLMLRFTRNSYEAISFLSSTMDDHPNRKKEFVLLLPPANRQLLDLLFTLIFMMDDFPVRSMDYELASYRQAREEYAKFHERFGTNPKWQSHFATLDGFLQKLEQYLPLTPEQKADPKQIRYWYAPYRLMSQVTASQPFMMFLERWMYGETSAQAHLNPAGLFSVGVFLMADFGPEDERKLVEERSIHQFTFRHFARTLATVLSITSEIEHFRQLGNRMALIQLWVLLGGYASEAEDLYKERYQAMLS